MLHRAQSEAPPAHAYGEVALRLGEQHLPHLALRPVGLEKHDCAHQEAMVAGEALHDPIDVELGNVDDVCEADLVPGVAFRTGDSERCVSTAVGPRRRRVAALRLLPVSE